jgi:hypothetical protein
MCFKWISYTICKLCFNKAVIMLQADSAHFLSCHTHTPAPQPELLSFHLNHPQGYPSFKTALPRVLQHSVTQCCIQQAMHLLEFKGKSTQSLLLRSLWADEKTNHNNSNNKHTSQMTTGVHWLLSCYWAFWCSFLFVMRGSWALQEQRPCLSLSFSHKAHTVVVVGESVHWTSEGLGLASRWVPGWCD